MDTITLERGKPPVNLDLIFATDQDMAGIQEIRAQDIMEGMTKNFHPLGLFSTEIFGKVGSEFRNRLFGQINLHVKIIHPHLYKAVIKTKSVYADIMLSKVFVKFDEKIGDFVLSNAVDGDTGYQYFFENYPKIKFEERNSRARKKNIKLLYKYKERFWIDRLLVLPAGLRDYVVDDDGKPSEDEINPLYRRVMRYAFSLESFGSSQLSEYLNPTRANIQKSVQDIYEHLINILKGKKGLILSHWASRRVFNTTRNVLGAYTPRISKLGDVRSVHTNQTVIGLYQYLRANIPICIKEIRERFSMNVFPASNGTAMLINPKTLNREMVNVGHEQLDLWMTYDGLEKIFDQFGDHYLRHKRLTIDGYHMALLYNDGKYVKMFFDIADLPENLDRKFVTPITLSEMLYYCVYRDVDDAYGFVTRFPVASYGGIYPCKFYVRTTVVSGIRKDLEDSWDFDQADKRPLIKEFPSPGFGFFDAMTPAVTHLAALGADHDGDTGSCTLVWTDEGKEECKKLLNSWAYYISSGGRMSFSYVDDMLELALDSMTA